MNEEVRKARWIAVLVATGIALYLCWLMLRPFLSVLLWAVVLVIVFYPIHQRISRRISRRGLSALLSSLVVIVVFLTPLVFVITALVKELSAVSRSMPIHFTEMVNPGTPVLGRISAWTQETLGVDPLTLQAFVVAQIKNAGSALLEQSLGVLGNVVGGIFKAFFVVFTMYYLFRDGEGIVRGLPSVLPFSPEQSAMIIKRTNEVISASVYGVVTIAMLQGFLGGIAFWVLGVPSPILWGVVLAFICMIPVAGSFFVWVPAAIYLFSTGHWSKAIALFIWGALVISTIDNFLRPRMIKSGTKLHELFIFFSVLGGISVFGLLGIVLGPMVLAITLGLLGTFRASDTLVKLP